MDKEILNKLKYLIDKKKTLEEICLTLNEEPSSVNEYIKYLKILGFDYDVRNGKPVKLAPDIYRHYVRLKGKAQLEICLLSDLHLGSLYDRPDLLKEIYTECERRGIDSVFCAGDYTDGFYPDRPSYFKYQKVHGLEETLDYVLNVHPYSRYIKFYTLSGNHDLTFNQNNNRDICFEVAQRRNDIIYLGADSADVNLGGIKLRIYHGYGKRRKTVLERTKKYYDSICLEERPDILQMGHIHHSFYTTFDNTHIFPTASLTDQLPFVGNNAFGLERSCWFVQIEYDEFGNVISVIPELKTFGPKLVRELK